MVALCTDLWVYMWGCITWRADLARCLLPTVVGESMVALCVDLWVYMWEFALHGGQT